MKIIDTAFHLLSSCAKHSCLASKHQVLFSISCTVPTPMMSYILISPLDCISLFHLSMVRVLDDFYNHLVLSLQLEDSSKLPFPQEIRYS